MSLQEHVVHFVLKLLSPSVPPGYTGSRSHLVDHMPMLSATLLPASSVDNVHIISLHGAVSGILAFVIHSTMLLIGIHANVPLDIAIVYLTSYLTKHNHYFSLFYMYKIGLFKVFLIFCC